jgi:MFS family permease
LTALPSRFARNWLSLADRIHGDQLMTVGVSNRSQLMWASFLTLIAAGMGFGIRAAILADWASQFGFTKGDLGSITGGGLTGFGIIILISSLFVDKLGYKTLLILALILHLISAAITLMATPMHAAYGQNATYWCLFVGMFVFAIANGLCEAVINPLVATIYPQQKTHYLNILHAGWPGGMILGAILAYLFVGPGAWISHLRWEIPMVFYLVPVIAFGLMVVREKFPISEARAAGISFGEMLMQFASPVLFLLLFLHMCIGYVELGTDSWITNIMNNVIQGKAILLFIYTSAIMFVLRFFAGPIVEKINPIGLLFASSLLGMIGLYWLGSANAGWAILVGATIYGLGKTFLWPTMLGVVGERFPRGGAVIMGTVGGVGMLSAGLLGGPGIGYTQDYYASHALQQENPGFFEEIKAESPTRFLFFPAITGLNGAKVEAIQPDDPNYSMVKEANIYGGRMALKWTAAVPLTMAVGYLLLIIYFQLVGGYKTVEIDSTGASHETQHHPSAEEAIEEGEQGPTSGQA